jgi:hypothetical protein
VTPLLVAPAATPIDVTPTVTPQPAAPTTPATPDPYTLPNPGAQSNLRPQSADSLIRESPDYRQLLQTTPSHLSSELLTGSPHTPAASLLLEVVSPLSQVTPTQPRERSRASSTSTDARQPRGRSLRDRLTAGCDTVLRNTGFQFACLSVLHPPSELDTTTAVSRLVLSQDRPLPSSQGSSQVLLPGMLVPSSRKTPEPLPQSTLTTVPVLKTVASGPPPVDVQLVTTGEDGTRDNSLDQLPARGTASSTIIAAVVAKYKALAKVGPKVVDWGCLPAVLCMLAIR